MPNHCMNRLKVVGEPKEVLRFIETITVQKDGEERLEILETIVPCPNELRNTTSGFFGDADKQKALEAQYAANREKYGYPDWYEWCINNWGTKWGDYDTEQKFVHVNMDKTGMIVEYTYTTAWGPALNGIKLVSEKFPTLWFQNSYEEGGMGFYGVALMHNGRAYADDSGEYPDLPENTDRNNLDAVEDAYLEVHELVYDYIEQLEMSQTEQYIPENLRLVAHAG